MNGIAIMLVAATVGVDYGWEPAEDGTLDYIIQIEPELYESLREGGEIVSEIHPDARNVGRIRIRIGRDKLPRVNIEPASKTDTQVRPASAETDAETTEPMGVLSIRGQTPPAENHSHSASRYDGKGSAFRGYNTPVGGTTNSAPNTGSSTTESSPAPPRYGASLRGYSQTSGVGATGNRNTARPPRPLYPLSGNRQNTVGGETVSSNGLPAKSTAPPLSTNPTATTPVRPAPSWRTGQTSNASPPLASQYPQSPRAVRPAADYRAAPAPANTHQSQNTTAPRTTTASATGAAPVPNTTHRSAFSQTESSRPPEPAELGQLQQPKAHEHTDGTAHAPQANLPLYGRRQTPPTTSPSQRNPQQPPYAQQQQQQPQQQPAYAAAQGGYAPNRYQAPPATVPPPPYSGHVAPYQPQPQPQPFYAPAPTYQVAATAPAPVAVAPPTAATPPAAPANSLLLTDSEREKPWPWLVFTIILLFASIGGNLYLGWIAWDFGERYKSIASELRGINLAAG